MIAVYHIKFISSTLNTFDLPYLNLQINLSLTSSLARPSQLLSFFEVKQFSSRIFNQHRLLGEKRTIPGFTRIKKCKGLQKSLKTVDLYLPKDDVILLCLASSTTPRRRNLIIALAQYTVTHFRSSSTKPSSWFLSSLMGQRQKRQV